MTPTLRIRLVSAFVVGGVVIGAFISRRPRIVHVGGFWSSLYWSMRSWYWNYPVTPGESIWEKVLFLYGMEDLVFQRLFDEDRRRQVRLWDFLRPLFASHGYDLYVLGNPNNQFSKTVPNPTTPKPIEPSSFPFAKSYYKNDFDACFGECYPRLWAARNQEGRDVVIKAVSQDPALPELQTLRILTSDALRHDPRNHTIPILEWIEAFDQVFVVMPRWDEPMDGDFITVAETLRFFRALTEGLVFMHEHGVAHTDIAVFNAAMDVNTPYYCSTGQFRLAGIHVPERRYAYIDFGRATIDCGGQIIGTRDSLETAFRDDVHDLAHHLQAQLMCVRDHVPAVVPLLNDMKDRDNPSQPSAAQVLSRFDAICSSLSDEVLAREVKTHLYFEVNNVGRFYERKWPITHVDDRPLKPLIVKTDPYS